MGDRWSMFGDERLKIRAHGLGNLGLALGLALGLSLRPCSSVGKVPSLRRSSMTGKWVLRF